MAGSAITGSNSNEVSPNKSGECGTVLAPLHPAQVQTRGLFKAGKHWVRKGPWRNAGYLYDVDACKETFQHWADDPPLRLPLLNCTRLHKAEQDLQGDVVHPNGFSYVVNDE